MGPRHYLCVAAVIGGIQRSEELLHESNIRLWQAFSDVHHVSVKLQAPDHNEPPLRAAQQHVHPSVVAEKAKGLRGRAMAIVSDQRDNDDVGLIALEGIDRSAELAIADSRFK